MSDDEVKRAASAIRDQRLALGWTQQHLAGEAGVSVATIRKLESGTQTHYRPLTVVPVCRALGLPPGSLNGLLVVGRPPDDDRTSPGHDTQHDHDVTVAGYHGALDDLADHERAEVMAFIADLRRRR